MQVIWSENTDIGKKQRDDVSKQRKIVKNDKVVSVPQEATVFVCVQDEKEREFFKGFENDELLIDPSVKTNCVDDF